jgi:phosphoribosylaminoimidazolecarboxamide formyltransferase/IMP cyclohydrolase
MKALLSVYDKNGIVELAAGLVMAGVELVSSGGTAKVIAEASIPVTDVAVITGKPAMLGHRVVTLDGKVHGAILADLTNPDHVLDVEKYGIDPIDLVVVNLYPFSSDPSIELIDIGGPAMVRASAKNHAHVAVVVDPADYDDVLSEIALSGVVSGTTRRRLARKAFATTAAYDAQIVQWLDGDELLPPTIHLALERAEPELRYGENPHQQGVFFGALGEIFDQLHGKELSYNNLVDVDAAVSLVQEFTGETAFVIIKHTNACGVATAATVKEAYQKAFAADTLSAFGGVLASSQPIDLAAAEAMNSLFFEILIAPGFTEEALTLLKSKKNRILLLQKKAIGNPKQVKSLLNGYLVQDSDWKTDTVADLKVVTRRSPTDAEVRGLLFASKICKHTKSNTIVLTSDSQLLASGVGQTSRVDALRQAIEKAKVFGFSLKGAAMASDAFFPFPDCVEIAHDAGIRAVIQPGGSIKDQDSIAYCDGHDMAMVFTGFRHFKH